MSSDSPLQISRLLLTGMGTRIYASHEDCIPLEAPERRQQCFFKKAIELLHTRQMVMFPEGAQSMVSFSPPNELRDFHREFAHLALRSPVPNLAILPVAIASQEEATSKSSAALAVKPV